MRNIKGVEAAIRNAAQDMHYLSIVFSGSSRSLLDAMFEDDRRPLYKLCRKLPLERIAQEHYCTHLNKAATLTWRKELADEVLEQILFFSDRHPYYVNYLCDVIWAACAKKPPTVADVADGWRQVVDEEISVANLEIANLSLGQRKVLKHVALQSEAGLMSTASATKVNMALSSISSSLEALVAKDIIEAADDAKEQRYRIINPVIKTLLTHDILR